MILDEPENLKNIQLIKNFKYSFLYVLSNNYEKIYEKYKFKNIIEQNFLHNIFNKKMNNLSTFTKLYNYLTIIDNNFNFNINILNLNSQIKFLNTVLLKDYLKNKENNYLNHQNYINIKDFRYKNLYDIKKINCPICHKNLSNVNLLLFEESCRNFFVLIV